MNRYLLVAVSLLALSASASFDNQLRRQVGQMVICGFKGTKPEDTDVQKIAEEIRQGKLGGVILYAHNIESPERLKELTSYLQNASPAGQPLLVAVDQEGGKVQRLSDANGFIGFKSHDRVANEMPVSDAHMYYQELAAELEFYGFNFNFAPVVDLKLNAKSKVIVKNERSFSAHPNTVYEYAEAFVDAHRMRKVLTSLKHWPGHGSAAGDSHLGMVDVTNTWSPYERYPYERMITEGKVDAVMTAHVFHRGFDAERPATMSKSLIQGMLRSDLEYDGVVITDCLQMGAITAMVGNHTEDAALLAILAGADIMLLSNFRTSDYDFADRLTQKVQDFAAKDDGVVLKRVAESNRRIAKLKQVLGGAGPVPDPVPTRDEL